MLASDEEKSVKLAKLCGWLKSDDSFHSYFPPNGTDMSVNHRKGYKPEYIFSVGNNKHNLYNPENMEVAWCVLNWAASNGIQPIDKALDHEIHSFWELPPDEAQRLWLDKIIELVVD